MTIFPAVSTSRLFVSPFPEVLVRDRLETVVELPVSLHPFPGSERAFHVVQLVPAYGDFEIRYLVFVELIVDATADLPGSLRLGLFLLLLLQDHAVDNKVEAGSFCIGGGAFIKRVPYLFVDSRALVFFVLVLLTTGLFRCGDSFLFFVVVFKMHVFDLLLKTCHLPLRFSLVVWPPPGDRGRFLIRRNNL